MDQCVLRLRTAISIGTAELEKSLATDNIVWSGSLRFSDGRTAAFDFRRARTIADEESIRSTANSVKPGIELEDDETGDPADWQEGATLAADAEKARIQTEELGDYFVGRRYYKNGHRFWGYVRRPRQQWSASQLVILNEKYKLAPDNEQLNFGFDNNYEFKLYGYFSGNKVRDRVTNETYPEFVLKKYELTSVSPAPIFKSQRTKTPVDRRTMRNQSNI